MSIPSSVGGTAEVSSHDELYQRVIWRLIPLLGLCYLTAYLDRINIGSAKLQMAEQLSFSETAYGLGAGLFFVGYILFEVPSNVVLEKVGARLWLARIMISWGILSGLTMLVTQAWQFYLLRFLLGAAEAGFLPGVLFYLTGWFPSWRRGRIIALFMIGLPLSSLVGGPVSGSIMAHADGWHGLSGWQWLFLLEAIPTVLLGLILLIALPDTPHRAKWLSDDERDILARELARDNATNPSQQTTFHDGFFNLKVWMLGGIDFAILLSAYAIGFWLPTFIRNAGVTEASTIGWLTSIPSLAGLIGMLLVGFSSDRHRERRWHIIVPFLIGATAMSLSTLFAHDAVATVIVFAIASCAIMGAIPVFFSLPATFLKGQAAATGFALACSLANIAGLVSNSLMGWILDLTGSNVIALLCFAATLLLACLLVIALPKHQVNR
ncbi:MFS transporter [Salinicola corii]|uniref:MFS transporter n=1 Tax=Salinicola corii TaxID=2606937 RepID=A0A640WIC5_9GAMM|nr:MFS transporter [Salinicola corii]KAA0020379.1 MFS transporter [Salinicola corii]